MRDSAPPLTTPEDRLLRAFSALGRGEPTLLRLGDAQAVVVSVETLDARRFVGLRERLGDQAIVAVTKRRAEILRARVYDGDLARIKLRSDARLPMIKAIADPTLALQTPLSGPHETLRGGDVALARAAITLCRRARLLPSALIWPLSNPEQDLAAFDGEDLAVADETVLAALEAHATLSWREVVSARVPIVASADTRLRLFRRVGGEDEHYVVEVGAPNFSEPVLTRLHSACATGDLFGSLKCDCGPQLEAALKQMGAAGGGVLIYLLQEGRGIGLANKLRAYRLQEDGFDTVEANHRLGFDDDERLLSDGGQILQAIGVSRVRLLTNNPAKIDALEAEGLEVVERVPLQVGENALNAQYLATKAAKSGHLL